MVSYKQLGLVNTREMFRKAMAGKYAIPAYNFNNMEQLQAIIQGCINSRSPVILQVSKGARKYANQILLQYMAQGAMEMIKASGVPVPVALHLDHGDTYELCVSCIESGFSSVMIDGSAHPYEKNVELTKKVVDFAHTHDVTVEGELGVLAGIEDEVHAETSHYTDPNDVEDFVKKTGVDSLAISIGTSHGAFKFKVKPGEPLPTLRFDILEEVERRIPGFPIVLHGASSVLKEYVDMINRYGGKDGRRGRASRKTSCARAACSSVCKINIDSDGRLVITAMIRKVFAEDPKGFDPRNYLGPARDELTKLIERKNKEVLGSAGRV